MKTRFDLNRHGMVVYPKMVHSQEIAFKLGVFAGGGNEIVVNLRNRKALVTANRSV